MRISDWSSDVCSSDLLPGVRLLNHGFFNEFTLVLDSDARLVVRELADRNILGGVSLGRLYPEAPDIRNGLVIAVTETTTSEDVDASSEEHTSELQSLMRTSYRVFCLNTKTQYLTH